MQLPVLPSTPPTTDARRDAIAAGLRSAVRGEVRFARHDRLLYATDASMYQVEPIGVVIPANVADAAAAVAFCAREGVAMLPRGGGTSLAGQTTSHAVLLDLTPTCRAIGELRQAAGGPAVDVEPGVSIDAINAELARRGPGQGAGLFFAPDPATVAQSAIAGNIATNAAGSRSIRYGRVSENLLAIDAALASGPSAGERIRFEAGAGRTNPVARRLAQGVIEIVRRHERLIRERYPKTLRQNAGYGLDRVLRQLDAGATAETLDLAQLLCGSEGTLAVTLGATLRLHPVLKAKGLGLVSFATLDDAIAAVPALLTTGVSAVELVDEVVIEAARGNRECSRYVDAFPKIDGRDPAAVLYVEYQESTPEEVAAHWAAAAKLLRPPVPPRFVTGAAEMAGAWALRKAGEPLLHGLPGRRKPLTFVEDNVVPVENLARFVREFRAIVEKAGTRAAFWAHASVGVLHVRPLLDPHDDADMATLRRVAVEVADLAKACGGVMSGEHGDGRIRGPLLERFFGPELIGAFREVKALFDPANLLAPGMIVDPGPPDTITLRTRINPASDPAAPRVHVPAVDTFFDYGDQEGFDHAVEMCNGSGVCRKTMNGTMCPSYRATLDERHSTRGRGNALRLAITGQTMTAAPPAHASPAWGDAETLKTLDLCLSCKACKTECPSNVDLARLKAEYTAQTYRHRGGAPLAVRLMGRVRTLNRLGALTPGLSNAVAKLPPVRAVINAVMGFHPRRSLPRFSTSLFRREGEFGAVGSLASRASSSATAAAAPTVLLFGDCFTAFNESHIGVAAGKLLTRLGYRVALPDAGCCGRAMISMGLLPQAIAEVDRTLARLKPFIDDPGVRAIVVAEPSCLSAMKDDWLQLRCATPIDVRRRLAAKAMLVEEFVDRFWDEHPLRDSLPGPAAASSSGAPVLLHAHCHQKALWGADSSARALRRVLGERLKVLDTGCCGMAGSFGYAAGKYDVSMKIANLPKAAGGVLPHVRDNPGATIAATGTSCRHQIKDATAGERHALHPIEILASALGCT